MYRLAENISVNQLPAGLFQDLIPRCDLVVLGDIPSQCPCQNHSHHRGQEQHHHHRIDDRKPMHLGVAHAKVIVPPCGPRHLALHPHHVVAVGNLVVTIQIKRRSVHPFARRLVPRLVLSPRMHHRSGHDLSTNNPKPHKLIRIGVVLERQLEMIVQVISSATLQSDREPIVQSGLTATSPGIRGGGRQVIHKPIHLVLIVDHVFERDVVPLVLQRDGLAQDFARLIYIHLDLKSGVLHLVSQQNLSQRLGRIPQVLRCAEGHGVESIGQLGLHTGQLVHLQMHCLSLLVLGRGNPRQIKSLGGEDACQRQR
mmetsp:Transcript_57654/g.126342  ORF Transcript_57654/g.126342 Transcript_57654/m.126342 type:complete len:312 (+) Transcript_57654:1009-1944(+)